MSGNFLMSAAIDFALSKVKNIKQEDINGFFEYIDNFVLSQFGENCIYSVIKTKKYYNISIMKLIERDGKFAKFEVVELIPINPAFIMSIVDTYKNSQKK